MLRGASRALFLARRNVLLTNTYGRGTSAWQANWNLDQQKQQEERKMNEASQRQRTMRKVDPPANSNFHTVGERWDDRVNQPEAAERRDSSTLWEKAKGAAWELKDSVSDKMEAAKDIAKDKFEDVKEVVGEKYEGAKEVMGEKLDDLKAWDKSADKIFSKPTAFNSKTNTSGRVGMNDRVLLSDLQGNLSPEDEILSNLSAQSQRSDAFHSKDNLGAARSTEELTIKDKMRDDKTAAAEHREQWKEERKLQNVTEGDMDDFLEPDYEAMSRQQQNLASNLKDTKRVANQTWNKAGESMVSGLDKTAKHLQSK